MVKSNDERVKRINALAKKAKETGLTPAEETERNQLREAYLKAFKAGFAQQIETLRIFDKSGNETTPEKVREIQRKKGLRDD